MPDDPKADREERPGPPEAGSRRTKLFWAVGVVAVPVVVVGGLYARAAYVRSRESKALLSRMSRLDKVMSRAREQLKEWSAKHASGLRSFSPPFPDNLRSESCRNLAGGPVVVEHLVYAPHNLEFIVRIREPYHVVVLSLHVLLVLELPDDRAVGANEESAEPVWRNGQVRTQGDEFVSALNRELRRLGFSDPTARGLQTGDPSRLGPCNVLRLPRL